MALPRRVQPLVVEDGFLVLVDRPGLGVEFDEEALALHVVG